MLEIVTAVDADEAVNLNQTSKVVAAVAPPQDPLIEPSVVADVAFCRLPVAAEAVPVVLQLVAGVKSTAVPQVL